MKRISILIVAFAASQLTACVYKTPVELTSVAVHMQMSNLLDNCTDLGAVLGTSEGSGKLGQFTKQAIDDMRKNALSMGADSVVVINTDFQPGFPAISRANGRAFKCN